jgi:hypothetical protein
MPVQDRRAGWHSERIFTHSPLDVI